MPTISLSIRGLTATLAIVVTLPSDSRTTGVFFLTAVPTSTATERWFGPPCGDCATALSPVNHLRGGNQCASSSVSPNRPEAAAQPVAATTNSQNKTLLLLICVSCRGASPSPRIPWLAFTPPKDPAPSALLVTSPLDYLAVQRHKSHRRQ